MERSRLWHQELQHQNTGLNTQRQNYWRYLLKQGLVPLFLSAEKSHRLLVSYTLQWTATEVCFLWTQGCRLAQENGRGTESERLQLWAKEFLASDPKAAAGTDLENTIKVGMWRQDTWQCPQVSKTEVLASCSCPWGFKKQAKTVDLPTPWQDGWVWFRQGQDGASVVYWVRVEEITQSSWGCPESSL